MISGQRASSIRKPGSPELDDSQHIGAILLSIVSDVRWSLAYIAFLIYIFVIVTYRLPIGDVAMGVAIFGLLLESDRIRFPPLLWWFGLFLVWSALGLVQSTHPGIVQQNLIDHGKLWLVAFVGVNVLRTPARMRFFLAFFLLCFLSHPARGAFFNSFIYDYSLVGRAVWNRSFGNPNDLAALTLLPLGVAASFYAAERHTWMKRAAVAGVVLLSLLIVMTQSRGGLLALAFFGILTLVNQRRKLRASALLVVLTAGMLFIGPSGAWERMSGLGEAAEAGTLAAAEDQGSADQRFTIWRVAGEITRDHPLFGVGLGSYRQVHSRYAASNSEYSSAIGDRDVHSTYLNVLAEGGIPGMLLFGGLLLSVILRAEKVRRKADAVNEALAKEIWYVEAALLAYLAAGLFGTYSRLSFLYLHLAVLVCLTFIIEQKLATGRNRTKISRKGPWVRS